MKTYRKETQQIEIRVKDKGELLLKGSIPYFVESETLYSKHKQAFIKECIAPLAFGKVLEKTKIIPKLLINHQHYKEQQVKSFTWNDTTEAFCFEFIIEPSRELLNNLNKVGAMWSYVNILDTKSQIFYAALLASNSH